MASPSTERTLLLSARLVPVAAVSLFTISPPRPGRLRCPPQRQPSSKARRIETGTCSASPACPPGEQRKRRQRTPSDQDKATTMGKTNKNTKEEGARHARRGGGGGCTPRTANKTTHSIVTVSHQNLCIRINTYLKYIYTTP